MEILEIKNVQEKTYGEFNLFWSYANETEDEVTFRFCPRPYDGRSLVCGFEITVDTNKWKWESFYENVLMHDAFIENYWKLFRLEFPAKKLWFKIVHFFKHEFEDCPFTTDRYNFSRLVLPNDYETHLFSRGVDVDDNNGRNVESTFNEYQFVNGLVTYKK